jgi:hypothetical protein
MSENCLNEIGDGLKKNEQIDRVLRAFCTHVQAVKADGWYDGQDKTPRGERFLHRNRSYGLVILALRLAVEDMRNLQSSAEGIRGAGTSAFSLWK